MKNVCELWGGKGYEEENTQESDLPGGPLPISSPLLLLHDVYILCIRITKIFMHGYGQIVLFSEETAVYLCLCVF